MHRPVRTGPVDRAGRVICPHCNASLLQRERPDRRCSRCHQEFALEPKENAFGLHDLRLRRLDERLSAAGTLRYTDAQLWYAAGRRAVPDRRGELGWGLGLLIVGAGMILLAVGLATPDLAVPGSVGLVAAAFTLGVLARRPIEMRMSQPAFRSSILDRWVRRYGSPLPGVVAGNGIAAPPPHARAKAALLCTDESVAACLRANRVFDRYGLLLTSEVNRLPPGLPVLVLHDASVSGCLLVAAARRAVVDRPVIDLGVHPGAAAANAKALRLRERSGRLAAREELSLHAGLTKQEIAWLEKGWWSPLAALPPAQLISRVASGVDRVEAGGDPDRRAAQAVGFMSWPEP